MGQRLVIHIMEKDNEVANAYYHWSGYTSSALNLLEKIFNAYNNQLVESCTIDGLLNTRLLGIRLLEVTGAGIYNDDEKYVREIYPGLEFNQAKNRNDGLISISKSSMDESSYCAESDLYIDIANKKVDFCVLMEAEDDEIEESAVGDRDYDDLSKNMIKKLVEEYKDNMPELKLEGYYFDNIPFDKIGDFCNKMKNIGYDFKIGDCYYSKIE